MVGKSDKKLSVALDIGTSKIAVLVGEKNEEGKLDVIGFGTHPSTGLKKGVVVNIEATVQSIQKALEEAELMSGCDIRSACTGIAGSHIKSINSHGIVAVRDREVRVSDLERVLDAARAVAIPADQKILHVVPQEYVVDTQEGVREPVGMSGVRLEAKVHIVTGAVAAAQNIVKCVERCGLQVSDLMLEQLASSQAVLTDDERELGVCIVDIGGGTTDIAVFAEGAIRHTAVIPIAGDHVTNDVAVALRTPSKFAETVKLNHASVLPDHISPDEMIEVPSIAHRKSKKLAKRALAHVVGIRYQELFALIEAELRRSGFDELLTAGIVLTGGAAQVDGIVELAETTFQMPVRLGLPQGVTGLLDVQKNPSFSTAVGLLLSGSSTSLEGVKSGMIRSHTSESLWKRMKKWFEYNF